ncbi:hypothetical protein EVAR_59646_1 [Eumeta japonica]|uniref:Uncharacterized protein n=1 Tax=Eumeta variegata TaxID=151549 RepID=A0A4C1YEE9_EUMVA|nr:hypothetical protein EVAR_59646_1 [Eumeta japonica]
MCIRGTLTIEFLNEHVFPIDFRSASRLALFKTRSTRTEPENANFEIVFIHQPLSTELTFVEYHVNGGSVVARVALKQEVSHRRRHDLINIPNPSGRAVRATGTVRVRGKQHTKRRGKYITEKRVQISVWTGSRSAPER